jgi:hypothetical protein
LAAWWGREAVIDFGGLGKNQSGLTNSENWSDQFQKIKKPEIPKTNRATRCAAATERQGVPRRRVAIGGVYAMGVHGKRLSVAEVAEIVRMRLRGCSLRVIQTELRLSRSTITKYAPRATLEALRGKWPECS